MLSLVESGRLSPLSRTKCEVGLPGPRGPPDDKKYSWRRAVARVSVPPISPPHRCKVTSWGSGLMNESVMDPTGSASAGGVHAACTRTLLLTPDSETSRISVPTSLLHRRAVKKSGLGESGAPS